jgi:8-oxo-dGTP pyrophosphatase MutT (NUDIX family)
MADPWEELRGALGARPHEHVADENAQRAAVALVLREGARGPEVLFIRRAEHPGDPWSGQIAFPGGRAEPGETDLRRTAVRETREETGLDLEKGSLFLGALDELRALARLRPMNLCIAPFVFGLRGPVELQPSEEVWSLHWIPLRGLLDPGSQGSFEYRQEGTVLVLPCIKVDGLVIWGLTHRMFQSLRSLLPPGFQGSPAAAVR